jgi:uncharacterized membrane protein YgaE (UPF0421/DUF939 family)
MKTRKLLSVVASSKISAPIATIVSLQPNAKAVSIDSMSYKVASTLGAGWSPPG